MLVVSRTHPYFRVPPLPQSNKIFPDISRTLTIFVQKSLYLVKVMECKNNNFSSNLLSHYRTIWEEDCNILTWELGPMAKEYPNFKIFEFPPNVNRKHWVYATNGMSLVSLEAIELHIFSNNEDRSLVELLTVIAYYHITFVDKISLNHTINFGRSWQKTSNCTFGLISLPYFDGPNLENFICHEIVIKCYWLIPITLEERNFKKQHGIEPLEEIFEVSNVNFLDPFRESLIN